jgi:hypothetical protein
MRLHAFPQSGASTVLSYDRGTTAAVNTANSHVTYREVRVFVQSAQSSIAYRCRNDQFLSSKLTFAYAATCAATSLRCFVRRDILLHPTLSVSPCIRRSFARKNRRRSYNQSTFCPGTPNNPCSARLKLGHH